jgi:hypothetical protein
LKNFIKNIFFANYFYGFCALSLTIETTLQLNIYFLHPIYYLILFLSTVFYYTKAYTHLNDPSSNNSRTNWYYKNSAKIKKTQSVFIVLIAFFLVLYLNFLRDKTISSASILILIFPLTALLYYGLSTKGISNYNLRALGWLKPILIGFTWAGVVTAFPLILFWVENQTAPNFDIMYMLLFIKNMMYVIILAILFDIKDYASDYNKEIKTFVVKYGLRSTIFYILLPLSIIGFGLFMSVAILNNFSAFRIILNSIPFLALLFVIYSMKKRRSILYYLIIIDGLLLLKGICGSIGMLV